MISEDFLKRTIRQIVEAITNLVGLAKDGRQEIAEQQLETLYLDHLGMARSTFAVLDPGSVGMILGPRIPIAIELLKAEAELRLSQGLTGDARELLQRVSALQVSGSYQ